MKIANRETDLCPERSMEKRNCRFIEDGVFYPFYFRDVPLLESFITLVERFFFFLFDSKRVAKGFQNFRIARELRDVIVNVNVFVEIRGNIASNRKGESKTREEKGKKGNKNK